MEGLRRLLERPLEEAGPAWRFLGRVREPGKGGVCAWLGGEDIAGMWLGSCLVKCRFLERSSG